MASAPKSAAPKAGTAGRGYRVQLAAVRSDRDARREWTRLRTRHSGLLGRLRHSVVRADLGDKGIYYRLRAGPLENKAAARTLCGKLTKIKVGCLVVRPGR
ncbi:MAG: SPOR domain-containing protein [Rhodospirillales bacterium]|nr:SPOR domain-containing protein [Rhodospirillales bacterium]